VASPRARADYLRLKQVLPIRYRLEELLREEIDRCS
jgi:hypothetical protein